MKNLLLLVLIGCVPQAAGQTSDTPDGGPRIETGRIAADKTSKGSVRGRVVMPGGRFVSQSLKVTLLTVSGPQGMAFTDSQGWFEFLDLLPGNYEVQAETLGTDFQVVNQNVQVFRGAPSIITITLADPHSSSRRSASPSISVGELVDVPKSARKEFELASKAAQENKTEQAIAHLRKAISIYPGFVMARNDLGAQLLAQGKLEEAAEELRQAILLDEKAFNPRLNLGIVLVEQQRFAEAAEVLERAVSLNPESAAGRLYSGEAQMAVGNLDNAEKDLKASYSLGGSSYSMALFYLGQLYMNKGDRELALRSFENYLREVPNAANADQVRKLIAMLH
ncbi:MAG: tetratricopeptide repeat protein [bacterium]